MKEKEQKGRSYNQPAFPPPAARSLLTHVAKCFLSERIRAPHVHDDERRAGEQRAWEGGQEWWRRLK